MIARKLDIFDILTIHRTSLSEFFTISKNSLPPPPWTERKKATRDQLHIETSDEYFIENLYNFNGIKHLMQVVLNKLYI